MSKEKYATLHVSCLQGNLNDVKKNIVKEWINPNIKSKPNCLTPLHLASWQGSEIIIRYLVEVAQADIKALTRDGNTCLHFGCMTKTPNIRVIEILISYRLEISMKNKAGLTPLMLAVYHAPIEFLNSFLCRNDVTKGILNMTDNCGCSALHHAAWSGRAKVVQLLLRHGVDSKLMDSYHRCASDLSVSNEIRKLLISHLNYTPEKRKILEPVEEKSHQKENFKKILSPESNLETKFYVSFSDLKTNPEILIEQSLSIFNGKQEIELESSVVGLEMSFPTKIDLVSLDRTIPVETGISFASSSSSTAVGSSLRSEKVTNSQLEIFNPFLVDDWSTSFTQDLCNISGLNLLRNNSSISSSIQNDFLSRRDDMMYYTKRKSVPNNDKIIEMPTTIDSTLKFSLPPVVAKYYNQSNTLVSTVGISKTTEKYLQKKQIHKIQAETMNNLNSKLFGADPFESGNGTLLTEKEYSSFDSSKGLNLVSKVNLNSVPKRIKTFIRPKSSSGLNESEPYELTDLANSASNSSYVAEFASIKDVSKNLPDNNLNVGISHKSKINQNITSDMPKLEKHLQRRQKHILRAFELEVESGLSFEDD